MEYDPALLRKEYISNEITDLFITYDNRLVLVFGDDKKLLLESKEAENDIVKKAVRVENPLSKHFTLHEEKDVVLKDI